jgi:hypothetical protein
MGKLKQMKKEFQVMDWSGNLPDLNPLKTAFPYIVQAEE